MQVMLIFDSAVLKNFRNVTDMIIIFVTIAQLVNVLQNLSFKIISVVNLRKKKLFFLSKSNTLALNS